MEAVILVVTMVLAIVGYFYAEKKARQGFQGRFLGRERLDIERLCDLFCGNEPMDRELTRELIEHVAAEFSISPSLLRPTDRFEFELKPPYGWDFDSPINILSWELTQLARKRCQVVESGSINTLNDYVRAMIKVY